MRINLLKKSIAWEKSINISIEIYSLTKNFPTEERICLTSQLRRCAVSIPSNIAEGLLRRSKGELIHFLGIAKGSCGELSTQLHISQELNYLTKKHLLKLQDQIEEVIKILQATINTLSKKSPTSTN